MSTYLFFNVPTTGHVDPTLPVAAELVHRGHQVVYFLTPNYRETVEATGAAFRAYPGLGADYFDAVSRRFNPPRLAAQLLETAVEITPALVTAIDEVGPRAILYDAMCPWGRIAARQVGLPAVASMSLLEIPPRYLLRSGEWRPALTMLARGLPWLQRYGAARRALHRRTGILVPPFFRLLNWPGDRTVCYTARQLLPDAARYGDDYAFVGPPVAAPAADVPFPFAALRPDRPLIYVSLGTVFNRQPGFFRACLDAFADAEIQLVVSTGRGLRPGDLAPLPDNAIVRAYVPQQAILGRASLFISHSGANSVHQALVHGVPMLLVPQQLEQALTAARLVELGAGLMLNRRRVDPARLSQMARQLLAEDRFRRQAAELGRALKAAGGATRAADVVEEAAGDRGPVR